MSVKWGPDQTVMRDRIQSMSDEELARMVSTEAADWRPEAVEMARDELRRRDTNGLRTAPAVEHPEGEAAGEPEELERLKRAETHQWFAQLSTRAGVWFLIGAVGAIVLPLIGLQFRSLRRASPGDLGVIFLIFLVIGGTLLAIGWYMRENAAVLTPEEVGVLRRHQAMNPAERDPLFQLLYAGLCLMLVYLVTVFLRAGEHGLALLSAVAVLSLIGFAVAQLRSPRQ